MLIANILNIVLPVFLVIAIGWGVRRINLVDDAFLRQTNALVYYVCLPLLLFYKIATADFSQNFNIQLVLGAALALILTCLISYAYGVTRHYPAPQLGAFTQGAFRGNLAYMGLAMVFNAYGDDGLTRASVLMGFLVPLLNFFAVFSLLWPQRNTGNNQNSKLIHTMLPLAGKMLANPLIIASFLGLLWSYLDWPIPLIAERSLSITTGMSLPLALFALGGGFSLARLRGDLVLAAMATGIKLLWMPLLATVLLLLFGVRGLDLHIGILMSASPAATATYIMAQQMSADAELAGSIVVMSTALSIISYSLILFLFQMG
jgi:hypothetical protein